MIKQIKFIDRFVSIAGLLLFMIFPSCNKTLKEIPILLFNGKGSSPNDVKAIASLLSSNHLDFTYINSSQLNGLDTNTLKKYKLIIIPGGNFIEIGAHLTKASGTNIRKAVHEGLNYLGICAGGFLAGNTLNNSFNICGDFPFKFYSAEDKGIRKTAVAITNADSSILEHYWEDGPQFTGWGEVVSKYPDGTPATVQGYYGSGWVVLTGVHPEAPESWRKEFHFNTSMDQSHQYMSELIKAALEKMELSHF